MTAIALLAPRLPGPGVNAAPTEGRVVGHLAFLVGVVANFIWLYPMLTDQLSSYPR